MDLRVLCNLRLPDARQVSIALDAGLALRGRHLTGRAVFCLGAQAAKTFGLLKLVVGASVATFIVTDVCRFCSHSVKGDSLKRWRALLGTLLASLGVSPDRPTESVLALLARMCGDQGITSKGGTRATCKRRWGQSPQSFMTAVDVQ
eukprot:scaffold1930_cov346-Prasinococcus_capsulatus_cf.AAC.20